MIVRLPHLFTPRDYQKEPFLRLKEGCKHFYFVEHRRAGKDKKSLNLAIVCAFMFVGLILYILPEGKQGKKAIWKGRGSDGLNFLDHIPAILKKGRPNSLEMYQDLENGSTIQIVGASNIDSIRGSNPRVVICSEFTYMSPYVRETYSPILAENGGIEILNGTPNGKGPPYKTFMYARSNPKEWCSTYLTVNDTFREDKKTPVITEAQINEFRLSGVSEEMIQQEYYCSWDSGSVGAYYTRQITEAHIEGRISNFEIKKNLKVLTFWDIGIGDSTAIWFLQPDGDKLKMINYYEACGHGFDHYQKVLREFAFNHGITYSHHFGPHDLRNRQWGETVKSTLRIAQECGISFMIAPDISIQQGINAVRKIFPQVVFHAKNCEAGIEALTHYKKLWDDELRVFKDAPLHDWSSHCADSFRYFAVSWMEHFVRPDLSRPVHFENKFQ